MLEKLIAIGEGDAATASATQISGLEQMMANISLSEKHVANDLRVMRSLSFEARTVRHGAIPEAYKQTFQWAFHGLSASSAPQEMEAADLEKSGLFDWLKNDGGIFWVSGKPGSGKSTFMKFVAGHPLTHEALSRWGGPRPVFIASHYFWISGTTMQKSQEGLLQSLLYDIFSRCPDLIQVAFPARWGG